MGWGAVGVVWCGVVWGAVVWAQELLPSHPALVVLQRKRQEVKKWRIVKAELEKMSSERPWHQAACKWHGMAPCGTAFQAFSGRKRAAVAVAEESEVPQPELIGPFLEPVLISKWQVWKHRVRQVHPPNENRASWLLKWSSS